MINDEKLRKRVNVKHNHETSFGTQIRIQINITWRRYTLIPHTVESKLAEGVKWRWQSGGGRKCAVPKEKGGGATLSSRFEPAQPSSRVNTEIYEPKSNTTKTILHLSAA